MPSIHFLSVVIPVYNEEKNLPTLFDRLYDALNLLDLPYEIIFVNDGSKDASLAILKTIHLRAPSVVKVVDFLGNFGQHMAIMAGFEHATGDVVVTLDADLQNPPEEIQKLLEKITQGHDSVGSYRVNRKDSFFRKTASRLINKLREQATDIKMTDQGCMLRAYRHSVVASIVQSRERSTFIPALAYKFSTNPTEIEVRHEERAFGESKYNLYSLIRLNFDLITGFSVVPLQLFTLLGLVVSFFSGLLVAYMVGRRLIMGPEAEGLFTLFAILIFLVSVVITGIGIVGEYIGRIAQTLSNRPRYLVREVISPIPLSNTQKSMDDVA